MKKIKNKQHVNSRIDIAKDQQKQRKQQKISKIREEKKCENITKLWDKFKMDGQNI